MARPSRIKKQIGPAPTDTLEAMHWAVRGLIAMLQEVLEQPRLTPAERRYEYLRIVDRLAKLRDTDRLFRAESEIRGASRRRDALREGPQLANVPAFVGIARRGRPPKPGTRKA